MKTIERCLCADCQQTLKAAQVIYKRLPNTEGSQPKCDWCRQEHYGSRFLIIYDMGREDNAKG